MTAVAVASRRNQPCAGSLVTHTMRNLALQGEVRHIVPAYKKNDDIGDGDGGDADGATGDIVAVIKNANADIHIGHYSDGYQESGVESEGSNQPPVSFVVTSDGQLLALDANDRLVWKAGLEKVVELDDEDEEEDEEGGDVAEVPDPDDAPKLLSRWFYAASFLQENSLDMMEDEADEIMGMNLGSEGNLHVTCLSRAGHVVSVSIDATNTLASQGCVVEEGGECIGTFENGLECGGWSPDGEVLALITFASDEAEDEDGHESVANGNKDPDVKIPILMTMNTQYEILSEVHLDPCLFALRSANDVNDSLHPNAISLCWRPDSSSLAISTMDVNVTKDNKPLRRIRTYNRTTLQLLSLSKEEDGSGRDVPNLLSVAPTWAPSGCSHYVGAIQSSRPLSAKSARGRQISMQVAFMEPNGLRHRECKIQNTNGAKSDKEDLMSAAFNLEGDLLAVTSMVTSTDVVSKEQYRYGKVQFYHRSNYHWYLKYELRFDGKSSGVEQPAIVSAVNFSEEDPYKIMVALSHEKDGLDKLEWREYTFVWESSTIHNRSSSVLAMAVDGKKLNLTPLDKAVIPPPMYASAIELSAPVVGIASRPSFHEEEATGGGVDFVIAMSNGKLALLHTVSGDKDGASLVSGFQPPSLMATADPFNNSTSDETTDSGLSVQGFALRDITIIDADDESLTLVALSCPNAASGNHQFIDQLVEMKISWSKDHGTTTSDTMITSSIPLEGRALRIVNWADTAHSAGARGGALLQLADGRLLEYSQGGILEQCDAGPLLEACPWVAGVYDANNNSDSALSPEADDGHDEPSPKRVVVGLSSRYRLYCGERLLSSASSSFEISLQHRFVAHVTIGSRPQIRFLPLNMLCCFDPLMGSDESNMALDGYEPRNVERGARLVAIFPTKPTLVIQMPRGNLETISPRALVLPYIMHKIQQGDFRTALDIMRRQRVDLNLIVDLDPVNFLEKGGAEQFIGQIEKIDNINLFLSSLIDVDTSLWKYPVPSWIHTERGSQAAPVQITVEDSKVNKVCRKVRQVLLDAEKDGTTSSGKIVKDGHFLLPILSTFAKENPPKLEEALSLIKNSASQEQHKKKSKKKSILLSDHVQSSIQYLAFLANYEHLFNTAIGMYDFDLAKAVARHSQMDPKIYLPMLRRWREEIPEAEARYEVDVKLKRYESALRHLAAAAAEVVDQEEAFSDEEDEHFRKCLKFIEEHSLHKLGLELFKYSKNNNRLIMISLGERLLAERKSEEALTVFLACNPRFLGGGKRASRACGDWRAYFACVAEEADTVEGDQVSAVAESISSKICSMREQQENYADAASILLDYSGDVGDAVDMLIAGHLWGEGRRIAHLHERSDLVKKVVDGSVSYARTCIEDLVERASTFEKSNARYAEVIVIRRDAIKEAEEAGLEDVHHDDSASMFSVQSTASNNSLRSTASGSSMGSVGSVGSVASVSTVISVGATSTFSFTGDVDSMKHKSKFNKIGRDKKKKKRKKKGPNARRMRPGSEEELTQLVATLKHECPDEHYADVIGKTITFLLQSDKRSMAILLFESYQDLESSVALAQTTRIEKDTKERAEREKKERKEGHGMTGPFVEHPCEKEIDAVICKPLNESVRTTFSFLL